MKLTIQYDGTDYHGWQRQPGLRTLQGELEAALLELTGRPTRTNASGRTDAGVHALGQVVQFYSTSSLECHVIVRALNALLPKAIRVLNAQEMPQAFHATLDAVTKRYQYRIDNSPIGCPFQLKTSWHIPRRLDHFIMHQGAQDFRGRHDFRSFETNWPNRMSSVRTVVDLLVRRDNHCVIFEVEADGFLYNMVRTMIGTLVLIGSGRRPVTYASFVLDAQDRTEAGPTAPPQGLFLKTVHYREPELQTLN